MNRSQFVLGVLIGSVIVGLVFLAL